MRRETRFVTDGDLIVVEAFLAGPRGRAPGRFVLDTGAASTTMIPELAERIGYSPRDGVRRTRVHTAIGEEEGYILRVAELVVLGVAVTSFAIHVFDLGHDDIDGLLGMNFLGDLNIEIRPAERRIFVEPIAH
jgi:clan AA aspartic protease (TIGR02281 family)